MKIRVISFTQAGAELSLKLLQLPGEVTLYARHYQGEAPILTCEESVYEWAHHAFARQTALVFIGAVGIAVRAIAAEIKSKLTDSPVVVMDEGAGFVIPLLSGHLGGANELAADIAALTGALPVITTATDVRQTFAVDLWAKEQGLAVVNKEGIARVSSRALDRRHLTMSIQAFPPREEVDILVTSDPSRFHQGVLVLCPREYALGIGCKKGISREAIEAAVREGLEEAGLVMAQIGAMASIDIKAGEEGLLAFAAAHKLPFLTFSAELLMELPGEFSKSAFVEKTVGVDCVCERAACALAGPGSSLILRKKAKDGVTVAISRVCGAQKNR